MEFDILDERVGFLGFSSIRIYRLRHRHFDDTWSEVIEREIYQRADAVAVLLYDPDADVVVMVEQFRPAAAVSGQPALQLEIVAGIIGKNEATEDVARREVMEEAGCAELQLIPIYDYFPSPGTSSDRTYLYCGLIDGSKLGGIHGVAQEGEQTRVAIHPFHKAIEFLEQGVIENSTSIVAIQWLALNRDKLRTR